LPFKDGLLRDNVRSDFLVVASFEENMGKLLDIVVGVVVDDNDAKKI
jgi:hypothetical protein